MKPLMSAEELIDRLKAEAKEENRAGMARFGIPADKALGVPKPAIRAIARETRKDHALALTLWDTGILEARILASLVAEPARVTRAMMEDWVSGFDSWDICDQVCGNLFDRVEPAEDAIRDWHMDEREFVRRAAFSTIAWRAVHQKKLPDETFLAYLSMIEAASTDSRNFVKKAVNWALRQIGKRNLTLHAAALELSRKLAASADKTASWIGRDAVKELESEVLLARLEKRAAG
ncbi:MAG: DNA alkylation repair protein [Nitratireductor sp.]|nr:DNA alkylation repair protein [Nitratireductor sp.]